MKKTSLVILLVLVLLLAACAPPGTFWCDELGLCSEQATLPTPDVPDQNAVCGSKPGIPPGYAEPSACNPNTHKWEFTWVGLAGNSGTGGGNVDSQPLVSNLPSNPGICEITVQELVQMRDQAAASAVDNLDAVGRLIAALDTKWESISTPGSVCGEWKNLPGNVPVSAVLWTNFHHQSGRYPVEAFKVDGDYGVFTSSAALTVVDQNSGGRYLILTGADIVTDQQMGTCVVATEAEQLRGGVDAYNAYFDRVGIGSAVDTGGTVTGPGYFLGTFGAGQEPASLGDAWDKANNGGGFVWMIPSGISVTAPNGGRFLSACP